jgi:hypothetical protein
MDQQIARMRALYPGFALRFHGGWHVNWEGLLRPLAKTYRVRVSYFSKPKLDNMDLVPWFPQVWLIDPSLERRARHPEEPIPHLYAPVLGDCTKSGLCLFDPDQNEWSRDMAIAETTLPWTIDWLVSYEGWHATGEWKGGGRDH